MFVLVCVTITVTTSPTYPATDPPQLMIEAVRGLQERHIDHLQVRRKTRD